MLLRKICRIRLIFFDRQLEASSLIRVSTEKILPKLITLQSSRVSSTLHVPLPTNHLWKCTLLPPQPKHCYSSAGTAHLIGWVAPVVCWCYIVCWCCVVCWYCVVCLCCVMSCVVVVLCVGVSFVILMLYCVFIGGSALSAFWFCIPKRSISH